MKRVLLCLFPLLILFSLNSCGGGGGSSGGSETLRTVQVLPPTLNKTVIDADVATWKDVNGDGYVCDFVNDTYTIKPDLVDVTITVQKLPNLPSNLVASPVRVDSAEIIYHPSTTSTPSIPAQYRALGVVVNPDSSVTFSLDVVTQSIKLALVDSLICSDRIYQYYVEIKFKVIEINSGKEETVQTALTVKLADFAEQQED